MSIRSESRPQRIKQDTNSGPDSVTALVGDGERPLRHDGSSEDEGEDSEHVLHDEE